MGEAVSDTNNKNIVQSAAKVFALLRAFDVSSPELTLSELAGRTGQDRGTTFRLIQTLVCLGYLASIPNTRRFRLTLKCLELGYTALAQGGLRAQAGPLLRELVSQHADTASLGVIEGADIVSIECAQNPTALWQFNRQAGSRTGAYAAALGHAILAWLPVSHARAILESTDRPRLSERTLVDIAALEDRLATVRAAGYAVSDGENTYGLCTIAAPILNRAGLPVAGISMTVSSQRMEMDVFQAAAVEPLLQTVATLTQAVYLTESTTSEHRGA